MTTGSPLLPPVPQFLVIFVPYFDLDVIRFGTPPYIPLAVSLLWWIEPTRSSAPRIKWYFTPGQSCARPPRTITTECCCTLCPIHRTSASSKHYSSSSPLRHTFTWDISSDDSVRAQFDLCDLALRRVRFLGLHHRHF